MRAATVVIALSMAMAPVLGYATPVSAESCEDSGWGDQTASCVWHCNGGWTIRVQASVDDNGWVEGTASCSGATAECASHDGFCSEDSQTATTTSGNGNCKATGNGGTWTNVKVTCSHASQKSNQEIVQDWVEDGEDLVENVQEFAENPPENVESVPTSSAVIEVVEGEATGYICEQDTGVCTEVPVHCSSDGDRWSCSI